ncbi:TIGR03618 family F420-dependent PPOX class oxidoreductase [Streptomyces sp. TRM66268-LWL]|uniref:TIGR03618 family F420-dependent PPOX class oxidoreductase n=1 Tax=Streptomyces polyasparticus TaxID=2767826 RepID=A0ABR7SA66_9ACTN|nr:TIGR03618 family F420-dependent PPOX class oxidoreductase [Streptomyces polyasparticus]MBC9712039.1 TIGR03618 family F420-dependent PPOX class oxidoreductase [Streptomyces polyasparticus]
MSSHATTSASTAAAVDTTAAASAEATATANAGTATASRKPASGPAPRVLSDAELSELLGAQQFSVLATVRRTGHPHLSTVLHHWDPQERILRISTTAGRLKVRQIQADPHAALHVSGPGNWSFAVAEGEAEVSGPTMTPGDAVGRELLSLTPGFSDPDDELGFLEQLVDEQRVVIRLRVSRLYGTSLDIPVEA